MRRRYQDGNVKKQRGVWIAQWWENGHRRSRALGSVWEMTKTEAKAKVAAIVAPFNLQERTASERCYFADFGTGFSAFLPAQVEKLNGLEYRGENQLSRHFGVR